MLPDVTPVAKFLEVTQLLNLEKAAKSLDSAVVGNHRSRLNLSPKSFSSPTWIMALNLKGTLLKKRQKVYYLLNEGLILRSCGGRNRRGSLIAQDLSNPPWTSDHTSSVFENGAKMRRRRPFLGGLPAGAKRSTASTKQVWASR